MAEQEPQSSGVQELIDRLQQEGVAEGRTQAEGVVAEARKQAARILEDARRQSDEILGKARVEADHFKEAGEEALRLASRDAMLALQSQVYEGFRNRLHRLIAHTLEDDEFLKRLVLEVAGKAVPKEVEGPVQVLLPETELTAAHLREHPESTTEETLTRFVLDMTADSIRDGITFDTAGSGEPGICVRLVEDDVQIELTADAITELLMRHLLPRFRAVMADD